MSFPYISKKRVINFNTTNNLSVNTDLLTNNSYDVVSRLHKSILCNNFEEFKNIYITEYLYNPEICDYFKYEDENNNWWVNTYSLCECVNKEDEPVHIHKNMNTRQCNCINGKRYLAYLCAFNMPLGCICYDTNPVNLKPLVNLNPQVNLDSSINEEIKHYLLKCGPIDLSYNQFYYNKK